MVRCWVSDAVFSLEYVSENQFGSVSVWWHSFTRDPYECARTEPDLSMKILNEANLVFAFFVVHVQAFDLRRYANSEEVFISAVEGISKEARRLSDKITDEWQKADVEWVHVDPRPLLMEVSNQLKVYRQTEICGTLCIATLLTDALEVAGVMIGYQCQTFNVFTFWVLGFLTLYFEQKLNLYDCLLTLSSMWSSVGYGQDAPPTENWGLRLWHGFHAWAGVLFVKPLADQWTLLFLAPLEGMIAQRFESHDAPLTVREGEDFCKENKWVEWFTKNLPNVETDRTKIGRCFKCTNSGDKEMQLIMQKLDESVERDRMHTFGCESQYHLFQRYTVDYFNAKSNSQQRRFAAVIVLVFNVAFFSVIYSSDVQLGFQRQRVADAEGIYGILNRTKSLSDMELVESVLDKHCAPNIKVTDVSVANRTDLLTKIGERKEWNKANGDKKACVTAVWWLMPDPASPAKVVDTFAARNDFLQMLNESEWPNNESYVAQKMKTLYTPTWEEALADSLYMVMMTASTVGYGDFSPVTKMGKALSPMLMQYTTTAFEIFGKRATSRTSDEKVPGDLVTENDIDEVITTPYKPWYDRWAASCVDISNMPASMREFWEKSLGFDAARIAEKKEEDLKKQEKVAKMKRDSEAKKKADDEKKEQDAKTKRESEAREKKAEDDAGDEIKKQDYANREEDSEGGQQTNQEARRLMQQIRRNGQAGGQAGDNQRPGGVAPIPPPPAVARS